MSKGVLILGAAVIALALFWKPITDMLNGIIGGGSSATDPYFAPHDTSTSQGSAYDPLNPDAGNPLNPGGTYTKTTTTQDYPISDKIQAAMYEAGRKNQQQQDQQNSSGSSGSGDSGSTQVDKTGVDTANTGTEAAKDAGSGGILDYLKTPDGMVNAAIVGSIAAPAVYNYGKPAITKAYQVLKDIAPKVEKEAPKLIKRAGALGLLTGAVALAASDKGAFGIGDTLTKYVTNPLIDFTDTVLGRKPVNAFTGAAPQPSKTPAIDYSQNNTTLQQQITALPAALEAFRKANSPAPQPAAPSSSGSGITVSNQPKSTGGVSVSNRAVSAMKGITSSNLSPVIAAAINKAGGSVSLSSSPKSSAPAKSVPTGWTATKGGFVSRSGTFTRSFS